MSLLYACNHVFPLYFRNHIRWTIESQLWLWKLEGIQIIIRTSSFSSMR
jgi:hypothetical protein